MIEGSGSVPWLKSLLRILNSDGSESILVGWIWRRAKMTHKIFNFFGADPGSGMEKSRIRDKHPGSATLDKNFGSGQY